jgi:hypothetical protein
MMRGLSSLWFERGYRPNSTKYRCRVALSNEGDSMKERVLYALSQAALEGKRMTQLKVFSQQAKNTIMSSAEFFRGAFLDVPVVFSAETNHPVKISF